MVSKRKKLPKIHPWFRYPYNKVKMVTEKVIQSYDDYFDVYIISKKPYVVIKRMRLDVSVNILTFSALEKKR